MSADLFAEFASFSGGSQQPQTQSAGAPNPTTQPPVGDSFSFLSPTTQRSTQQPTQSQGQWPSFQTQPGSGLQANSWSGTIGNVAVPSNQPVATSIAEEDDGWGDFEVASPVSQETPPSHPVAATTHRPAPSSLNNLYKPAISSQQPPQPPALQRTRVVRASTMDLMTNSLVDMGPPGPPVQAPAERPSWGQKPVIQPKPRNQDPNVLFDADDFELGGADDDENEEDEDDFGDFETVAPSAAPARPAAASPPSAEPLSIDLMSSEWTSSVSAQPVTSNHAPSQLLSTLSLDNTGFGQYPQAPKSPGFQDRNPFPGLAVTTPKTEEFPIQSKAKSPSPVTIWPSLEQQKTENNGQNDWGDDWAAFDDPKPKPQKDRKSDASKPGLGWEWDTLDSSHQESAPSKPQPKAKPPTEAVAKVAEPPSDWGWDEADQPSPAPEPTVAPTSSSSIPDDTPPPTNVPPPSILLSIFPSLFDVLDTAIFKPTAAQPAAVRNKVLASPKTAEFLSGYLLLATVASRIIAGRKLRWHRDKFLAQSMSISAAGGKGGMKLAGVDRTQSAREDREAADVVSAWRRHVGRLRSAVATANSSSPSGSSLKVPEMAEALPVQTAKMVPTAPKACIVCGLKREERVKGVDFEVEDSFGEWWVEHWGHRACRNFWLEHEARLRSK